MSIAVEPDEIEDEEDEDLFAPSRISFFSEGPDADEKVCDMVWTIFVKDSNGRGIDARSKQQRLASQHAKLSPYRKHADAERKAAAAAKEEAAMARADMGKRDEAVLAAYKAHVEKHGSVPSSLALAKAAGVTAASDGAIQTAIWASKKRLAEQGLLPAAPKEKSSPTARPAKAVAPKNRSARRAPTKRIPAKPTNGRSTSSSLDVLRAELLTFERKADALRDAIAILEAS